MKIDRPQNNSGENNHRISYLCALISNTGDRDKK